MKLWHGIAIVAGLALIAWGIFSLVKPGSETWIPGSGTWEGGDWTPGHWSSDTSIEESDLPILPSYTADQVIAIAQAKYPACYKHEMIGKDSSGIFRYTDVQTPPSITVDYIGGSRAAWKVVISCPYGYYLGIPLSGSYLSNKTIIAVYFYETDGSLHDTYYP